MSHSSSLLTLLILAATGSAPARAASSTYPPSMTSTLSGSLVFRSPLTSTPVHRQLATTTSQSPLKVAGQSSTSRDVSMTSSSSTTTLRTTPPLRAEDALSVVTSPTEHIKFNCQRPRTTCSSNATCSSTAGNCLCQSGWQGYDCSLQTRTVEAACDPPCLNSGSCYSASNPDNSGSLVYLCYCTEAFHGESCEKERVYHKCNPDSMELSVTPIVGVRDVFAGAVYVLGHEDESRCIFNVDPQDSTTFINTIDFDDCGGALNQTDANGVTSLSWRVVVRYDDVLLDTDQELMFTCFLRQPGSTYNGRTWLLANDLNNNLPKETVSSDVQPVLMSLQTVDGRTVDGPQQLGTSLMLKYTLNGGNVYDSFRVERVVASNYLPGDKHHSVVLVDRGCVTADAQLVKKIVQSLIYPDTATAVLLFKVFKLRFTSQLVFENHIKACYNSADCNPPNCTAVAVARKKRHLDDVHSSVLGSKPLKPGHDVDKKTASYSDANATLTVWYPADTDGYNYCGKCFDENEPSAVGCVSHAVFIAVAVLLVGLVITFAVIFAVCLHHRIYKSYA